MRFDRKRNGLVGYVDERSGSPCWRRQCELRCRGKSVFHFDVQGLVAKSTQAGLPWRWLLRGKFGARPHFWPFDGWELPAKRSTVL